ncbi:hypothetical protein BH24ACT21_BH24ACT21_16560 [soil metagenome]|jgi:hypothetical protein
MVRPGASRDSYGDRVRPDRIVTARLAVTLLAAMVGSVAGGVLWLPMAIILPFWIFLTLPQLLASLFGSSMAYLVAGAAKARLSYTMAFSLIAGAICAAANVLLFMEMVPGIAAVDDLTPPGGMATLLLEALAIGAVAGGVALRSRQGQQRDRAPFWVALSLSILAIAMLLWVGSAIVPDLWLPPPSARNP